MNQEFQVHVLNEEGKKKAVQIATAFDACLETLRLVCPTSREFSLAKTHLEEACFFAKKAMASQPENCTP